MAMIADAFVGKLVEKLAGFVEEKVILVLGVKDELERLQRRLSRIRSVLKDAERRRIEDEAVNHWLNELKGVMYDADDILDLCRFEGGKLLDDQSSKSSSSSSSSPLVRCYSPLFSCFTSVPLRHEIGQSIKNLNDRLEEISSDKLKLALEPVKPDDSRRLGGVNPRQTSSLIEYSVVGRDIKEATRKFVEWIVGEEEKQKCRVFAIVGMGGIGKTTLAQNLFNEPRIQESFQHLIWVCVSQNFSETNLLKQIIRSAGGDKHEDAQTKAELQPMLMQVEVAQTKAELLPMLMQVVRGKRLFLVLDDVWSADVWVDLLRNPLQTGAANCSIVVTTRSEIVANKMKPVRVHRVEELPIESGWELLCNIVFRDDEEEEIQCLRDVGIQIINKCHGLPLAIKTIAGVLLDKERTRGEWEKVARSKAWSISQLPEELRGALYLSYEDLPSHLKQCFLYLSLFPEDYEYFQYQIVSQWIARGFVETHDENSLEDTAEEYYRELIRRSILHPLPQYLSGLVCTMHDLLRSLACFLSGNECFFGDVEGMTTSVTSQLRHMSIVDTREITLVTNSMIRPERLRTLFLLQISSTIIDNDLISRFQFLRVLFIRGKQINCIPNSIGDLIHMRCLDLDDTRVSELPESLGRLTNLQILNLRSCISLHTLPKSITQLDNLRFLNLFKTPMNHVPKGVGKLKQLTLLSGFVLGDDDSIAGNPQQGCDLEDLQYLSQLRILRIHRLERASTGISALQSKSNLKELFMHCSQHTDGGDRQSYTDDETDKIEATFNELKPPSCLQVLGLYNFFGRRYPNWLSASLLKTCLPNLSTIELHKCMSCPRVPPLGELPQLKHVIISGASTVVTIGPEFIGAAVRDGIQESTSAAFPKLELLRFAHMTNWKEWSFGGEAEERTASSESRIENRSLVLFPRLQKLTLVHCPNLRILPKGLEQATNLHELRLSGNSSLEGIPSLPALKLLSIKHCPAFESVGSLNVLTELILTNTEMECLPGWLIQLLQQRLQAEEDSYFRLDLCCNVELLYRCLMDGPDWSIIQQFPKVDAYTEDTSAYLYYTKEPFSFRTNHPVPESQDPKI